jgi:opacity protein-like surface antigen
MSIQTQTPVKRSILLAGIFVLAAQMEMSAQTYFRDFGTSRSSAGFGPVVPSEYTFQEGSPNGLNPIRPGQDLSTVELAEEQERYNFAIGPMRFSLAAGVGLEFNDNLYLSDNDRESGFAIRPLAEIDGVWRLTDLNTLRFNIGVSYAKYFDHPDLDTDGVLISPNSEISLTFYVSTLKFTIRQRVSYQEDTYDTPAVDNVPTYGRWEYQGGLEMDWQINQQVGLIAGYEHYNLWARGEFDDQDRGIDSVYLRPGYQVSPALKVGLNTSYSYINFQSSDRADGDNVMVGPFLQYQLSQYTNFYLEAGYQDLNFDGTSNFTDETLDQFGLSDDDAQAVGQVLDNESSSSWYMKFEIQNRPSDSFQHRISGSKTAEIGFDSDYYDLYHIGYDAEWQINEKWDLGPSIFYEYYESSGSNAEKASRYGASVGIRTHLSDSITIGLDYRFLLKNSNLPDADYYQNVGLLSVYYKF